MSTVVNASAGVYIDIEDRSQVNLLQQQVSVGAIVLFSKKGPVDQLVKITNGVNQFLSIFGQPDKSMSHLFYGHKCAVTALSKMKELYVTRVHRNAKFGGIIVGADGTTNATIFKPFTTAKCVDPENPNKFYMGDDVDFDSDTDYFYVYGADPNNTTSNYRIAIKDVKDSTDVANPNTFKLLVYGKTSITGKPLETWTVSRKHQVDGYGRQQYIEKVINGKSKFIRILDNTLNTTDITPTNTTAPLMHFPEVAGVSELAFMFNGDSGCGDATNPIAASDFPSIYNGTDAFPTEIVNPPVETKQSGWQLYYDREEVKFDLLINGGVTYPSVQKKMLNICDTRNDCFAILDIAYDKQGNKYSPTADPIDYRTTILNVDTPNGALYSPWYEVTDQYSGSNVEVPPSGHIAAIYCAVDTDYATWFAPAGLKRGLLASIDPDFVGATMTYKQADRDQLEEFQVNCTRLVHNIGLALWSASTLQIQESAQSNVNVVRLLKYLVRNIDIQLLYNVFDPNDIYLRSELIQRLTDIFEPIKLARGLYGYNIVCAGPGETNANNTYDDIALGNLNVDIYLSPVIPAKRIMVRLIVNKAGATLGPVTTLA